MTPANNKSAKKVPVLEAFIKAKCPRCRRGDIYSTPTYGFSAQRMHERCSHCNLHYEREPGYWYVAMFVSYTFNVAEMVTFAVGTHILTGSNSPWLYVGVLMAVVFLLSPFNYRYSRVALLYWLTPGLNYEPWRAEDKAPLPGDGKAGEKPD
ncbi:DUF983 domain-containing protein [Mucilaginibacter phyllosphaerae]|uniref:DUF983 domain-containing protein n=1 Tax=Mucilaginibacter phyllosphaerae TaxID=1812349 RepID=A0A4Y8AKM8_9SPHI|nr:DUF983 domain-containing protein [Mucilaginibacter phyllosphaerae]MBB3967883.1 uncharacterized protein (DUF983 family) [Mucilaginibacter phyllosphaerae]TEW69075.1 DUF983 domain-containing protein [Mucilaginibacter phyllosphaerae]GGH02683.1 hypothetical protein GCM10007352_05010 [Mucilaginibacter phyllosphaerae]